jgi:two-component system, OmpR family, sensor histidine kinase MtrB
MAAAGPTLRRVLTTVNVGVATIVLLVCGALVVSSTALHRVSVELASAVESVRIFSDAEVDLLLYARARDSVVRAEIEERLRRHLGQAKIHVSTETEAALLRDAESALTAYARGQGTEAQASTRLDEAFTVFDALVETNVDQAREAARRATNWDRRANGLALAVASLTILLSLALVWWLKTRLFQPVLSLSDALGRFARGEHDTRLEMAGPLELRETARCFNEMADTIARQRANRIAFLGGVAHDLRTPLSALALGLASVERDQLEPGSRLSRTLEVANRQVARLDRMIGDFLELGRIDAGQLELRVEQRDAREVVDAVVDLFESAWHQHPLELELPDHPVLVHCDPLRIEQVITNLVSNALKYSPAGSVIRIDLCEHEQHAVIGVRDQGIGISDDDRRVLFEPFRRVGLSKEAVPGVGLGLFVVKRIVEAHGGRVEVTSAPSQGSTFRVWLPLDGKPGRQTANRARKAELDR